MNTQWLRGIKLIAKGHGTGSPEDGIAEAPPLLGARVTREPSSLDWTACECWSH